MTHHPRKHPQRSHPHDAHAPPAAFPLWEATDPAAAWNHLLEANPDGLALVELEPGVRAWLALTWDMHDAILRNPQSFSRDARNWRELQDGTIAPDSALQELYGYRRNAMSVDGEDHEHLRTTAINALRGLDKKILLRHITVATDELIDAFAPTGQADLVGQFAHLLPRGVLCRLFGMTPAQGHRMVSAMQRLWDGQADAGAAHEETKEVIGEVVRYRRDHPGEDLTSALVGQGLSDRETNDQLIMILAAADDPVTHLIGNTLRLLLTDRDARTTIGTTRTTEEVINASLWEEPPLQMLPGRYALHPMTLGGMPIRPGDCFAMGFGPAHHQMLQVSGGRETMASSRSHLIWGLGIHACPTEGRTMTWAMVETAVEQLMVRRLPDVLLAVPPDRLEWRPSAVIRGLKGLPVTFTPSPVAEPSPKEKRPWSTPSESTPPPSTTASSPAPSNRPGPLRRSLSRITRRWR